MSAVPFLRDLHDDPRVRPTMYEHTPRTLHQQRDWWESLDDDAVHLLIRSTDDPDPVGTASLTPFNYKSGLACVGYAITPEAWGNGYATAAVELLVEYGFTERRLAKLWASVYETTPASARVLETVGAEKEATHRQEAFVDGERVDVWYVGVLADE